jgi:hypothetical protein
VIEAVSTKPTSLGGDAGGVTGLGPGEHTGRCLFGIAAGVPRDEVLSEMCVGGVEVRAGIAGALATAAAMLAIEVSTVQLKARDVMC